MEKWRLTFKGFWVALFPSRHVVMLQPVDSALRARDAHGRSITGFLPYPTTVLFKKYLNFYKTASRRPFTINNIVNISSYKYEIRKRS